MEYVWLGRTGVKVSKLCYGTMSFGGDADADEAANLYKACREAGINFFDCADVYSQGRAEEILGTLIASERDNLVITSKCHGPTGEDINARGANRRHIIRAVEASLKRLNTDRLDVLFLHRFDEDLPLEETLRALEHVVQSGKVLYLGASNWAAWQVAKALGISHARGWSQIDVIQPMYSLVKRQAEVEILPMAQYEGLGVITYSPIGAGLLSGKFATGSTPNESRLIRDGKYQKRYSEDWFHDTARDFADFAKENGYHPVSLAVAWAGSHPAITAPIIGARNTDQLAPSLKSVDINMTADLRAQITKLSRTPPPPTDRLETVV